MIIMTCMIFLGILLFDFVLFLNDITPYWSLMM